VAPRLLRWKCSVTFRTAFLCAVLAGCAALLAEADPQGALYRVDRAGIGSCYDADVSLMLAGHVFAYLAAGALEISFSHPPAGINARESVLLLGDMRAGFPEAASRYILQSVLGKDVLLAFDSTLRSATGALLAYVYLREDGSCVNFTLVRNGLAAVARPDVPFQFRSEFDMYERQAMAKRRGIWRDMLGMQGGAGLLAAP
jgi:Staphylococcal nuclease homologue